MPEFEKLKQVLQLQAQRLITKFQACIAKNKGGDKFSLGPLFYGFLSNLPFAFNLNSGAGNVRRWKQQQRSSRRLSPIGLQGEKMIILYTS